MAEGRTDGTAEKSSTGDGGIGWSLRDTHFSKFLKMMSNPCVSPKVMPRMVPWRTEPAFEPVQPVQKSRCLV